MNISPDEKNKLANIFKNFEHNVEDIHKNWKEKTNRHILLVDGNNLFIRSWAATVSLDENGEHVGGVVASLKSLGAAIKLIYPSRCIVVFDGVGGSFKRRKIYPDYKAHRTGKIRLNRVYDDLSDPKTEEENRTKQYLRFIQYLQVLPINIISIDHVEADDTLSYLATDYFKNLKVTIMSTDKDFLQLCNDKIEVYSPTKKRIYNVAGVLEEYQIHPNNFVLYRSLEGDKSDNIPGVGGAGLKTVIKHFPWLNEEKIHTIDEIVKHAEDLRNKYKVCENIASNKSIIERNVALMQLKETALTTIAQLHCNECLDTSKIPHLDRGAFIKLVREDMIDSNMPNHTTWLGDCFSMMESVVRSE